MLHRLILAAVVAGAAALTGCASVVNGQQQSVSVTTRHQADDLAGAKCALSNDKGVWYLTTPGSVSVHRSYGELSVSCAMAGLPDGTAAVKSSTTAAVFGNVLLGGVVGAGIDIATGAAYNYPNAIPVVMGQATRIEGGTGAAALAAPPGTVAVAYTPGTRVPYLGEKGQASFGDYLTRPKPRAFAIAGNGHWARAWTEQEPGKRMPPDTTRERALDNCKRSSGQACQLYAVDDQIFVKPPADAAPAPAQVTTR
jgi:hypothetical protein